MRGLKENEKTSGLDSAGMPRAEGSTVENESTLRARHEPQTASVNIEGFRPIFEKDVRKYWNVVALEEGTQIVPKAYRARGSAIEGHA